jgi:hypothetical protein
VAKKSFVLLFVVIAPAILSAEVLDQVPGGSGSDLQTPLVRSALACSRPPTIVNPMPLVPLVERAKLKARLMTFLRENLYDDAQGIVNTAPEKEIRELANKPSSDKGN